jgi:hypothetical protein
LVRIALSNRQRVWAEVFADYDGAAIDDRGFTSRRLEHISI